MRLPPFQISPLQSDLLDVARWMAAMLVVAEHLRSLMFVSYGAVNHVGIVGNVFYFLTNFGHSSVIVFFVMSGFLVGGKVFEKLGSSTFSWRQYFIDRSSRLYAVYFLALLLGAAFDYFGYTFLNRFGLYDKTFLEPISLIDHSFHQTLTVSIFGANAVMLQTIRSPIFGSNGPLWSLANEFWYYIAGPLALGLLFQRRLAPMAFTLAALAGVFLLLPIGISIYFLVWLIGAALYLCNQRSLLPIWIPLVIFLLIFGISRMPVLNLSFLTDFLIGISFALLINSAAGCQGRLPWNKMSRKMADFSYSVYLCHLPFAIFVLSGVYQFLHYGLREQPAAVQSAVYLSMLVGTYLWCYMISLATERQTPRVRGWLNRLIPFARRAL